MGSLRTVLQKYSGSLELGGKYTEIGRETLKADLSALQRTNEKYFKLGAVMAGLLFIALVVLSFVQLNLGGIGKAVPPILGTSAAGTVWGTMRNWREKCYTDCIFALIPVADDAMLKIIVTALLRHLSK